MVLTSVSYPLVEEALEEGLKVLANFSGVTWIENKPKVFLLNTREEVDLLRGKKTERWVKGFTLGKDICVINFDKLETLCGRKYSEEEYAMLVKHELCHLYYAMLTNKKRLPVWLIEGMAIYFSGQLKSKKAPEKFTNFLDYFSNGGNEVYRESGFVMKLLLDKFGKEKVVQLIKEMNVVNTEEDVRNAFKEIFGIDLTYEAINDLYTK